MTLVEKVMALDRIAAALEGIDEKLGRLLPPLPENMPVGAPDLPPVEKASDSFSYWSEVERNVEELREIGKFDRGGGV